MILIDAPTATQALSIASTLSGHHQPNSLPKSQWSSQPTPAPKGINHISMTYIAEDRPRKRLTRSKGMLRVPAFLGISTPSRKTSKKVSQEYLKKLSINSLHKNNTKHVGLINKFKKIRIYPRNSKTSKGTNVMMLLAQEEKAKLLQFNFQKETVVSPSNAECVKFFTNRAGTQ